MRRAWNYSAAAGASLPRCFVVRNARSISPPILLNPRYAISLLRGLMTRAELRRAHRAQAATSEVREDAHRQSFST